MIELVSQGSGVTGIRKRLVAGVDLVDVVGVGRRQLRCGGDEFGRLRCQGGNVALGRIGEHLFERVREILWSPRSS